MSQKSTDKVSEKQGVKIIPDQLAHRHLAIRDGLSRMRGAAITGMVADVKSLTAAP